MRRAIPERRRGGEGRREFGGRLLVARGRSQIVDGDCARLQTLARDGTDGRRAVEVEIDYGEIIREGAP